MNGSDTPYELTFHEREGYLYAHVKASTITEDIAMSYLREIKARCARINCIRLLIDRDIPATLPDGKLFFVAAGFQKMIQGIKTAFVNPYISNDDSLNFAIMVGTNRGGDHAMFNNVAGAEKWLLK
jgi:hypothetical protein